MLELEKFLTEIFGKEEKLVFLIGSGCSTDAPSSLADGRAVVESIINYICAESEIEQLLELKDLKFETLTEILYNQLDPELKVLDYFGLCEKPNFQHFFLADMIKRGNLILTTNFDSLIEHALIQSNINKNSIFPIINEQDYQKYTEIQQIFDKGLFPVIKLHGSIKNIISGKNIKKYLISLVDRIGSKMSEVSLFQIEPYKQTLIEKVLKDKIIIIMGYSGLNDFDILPILKEINSFKKIIWINHINHIEEQKQIIKINKINEISTINGDRLDHILIDLKKFNQNIEIIRINANTTRILKLLSNISPKIDSESFNIKILEWLKKNLLPPNSLKKYLIPHIIYFNFNRFEESYKCGIRALEQISDTNDVNDKVLILNNLGWINYTKGNFFDALEQFEEALKISIELGNESQQAIYYNNLGEIHEKIMNYPEALLNYRNAILAADNSSEFVEKQRALNSIIEIFENVHNFPKALESYDDAIKVAEIIDDFETKAIYLNNIATIYCNQEEYPQALELFQNAGNILRDLDDKIGLAINFNNIGVLHQKCGYFSKAIENFDSALKIDEKSGNLLGMARSLYKIGGVYFQHEEYNEAIDYYKKAIEQIIKSDDKILLPNIYNDLGKAYYHIKKFHEALDAFFEGLHMVEKQDNLLMKPDLLNNLANCYYMQLNYEEFIRYAKDAHQCLKLLGLGRSLKATSLKKRILRIENQLDYR